MCKIDSETDIGCFDYLMFPIVWLINTHYSLISLFTTPILLPLYIVDQTIFIDTEATMNDLYGNDIPKQGFPMLMGQIQSQMRLVFGDYEFIEKPGYYHLNFVDMVQNSGFSFLHLVVSLFLDPLLSIWATWSLFNLLSTYFFIDDDLEG